MAIDPNLPNPYLPATDAEVEALAQFKAPGGAPFGPGTRSAFRAGTLVSPQGGRMLGDREFEVLWNDFVDADLEIPRTYPTAADAFMAGYRTAISPSV